MLTKSHAEKTALRETLRRRGSFRWVHAAVVVLSIGLTVSAWHYSRQQLQEKIQVQFDREAERTVGLVLERMKKYEEALSAATAFIEVDDRHLTNERWRQYVDHLEIHNRYPGINGMGVIFNIPRTDKADFIKRQRTERPDFQVHPNVDADQLWPITHIAPEHINAAAVGLDMAHETNRRVAAEKARDTGTSQVTGPIVLVQDEQRTPGFLFYTPFYGTPFNGDDSRTGLQVDAPEIPDRQADENREQFRGLVYAPFVVKKLMRGTMEKDRRSLGMRIRDGEDILFDENLPAEPNFDPDPMLTKTIEVPLYGRIWSFDLRSDLVFRKTASSSQPATILWAGLLIDGLLIAMFISISRASRRSLRMADQMTKDLQSLSLATHVNRIGIWDYDPINDRLLWDDTMFELYGCHRNDFEGEFAAWHALVHPDDQAAANEAVVDAIEHKQSLDILFRVVLPDRSIRYIGGQAVVFRDNEGNATRMLGANTDMSDRMSMVNAMEENQQRQRAIDAAANVAIIGTDTRGKIIHFNRGAEKMLGYDATEVIEFETPALFHDSNEVIARAGELTEETGHLVEPGFDVFVDEVRRGENSQREWTYIRKDGSRLPVLLTVTAIHDQHGQLQGFLSVAADISERVANLRAIAKANVDLQRSNTDLAQFAYVASHDLQAPLRRIISLSGMLREEIEGNADSGDRGTSVDPLSEDAAMFMQQIETCSLSMKGLINDLLSYSRIETEERKLIRCDTRSLMDSAIVNLSEVIADCDGNIEIGDLPDVDAEPQQLVQLFQNLIGNALKYRGEETPHVLIHGEVRNRTTRFTVADNGIGIAPEHRERVFGVFKRLHAESVYQGNGIGLAICRRIVDRFDGRIWIDDSPLGGIAFHFELPHSEQRTSTNVDAPGDREESRQADPATYTSGAEH